MNSEILQVDRGPQLHRWRTTLGWDAPMVASLLGVSVRTIGLWETSVQPMPDARWRLFVHEVVLEVTRVPKLVVVFADDKATVIDVVSDSNYAGLAIDDDGQAALIASYAVERQTGQPRLHRQRFSTAVNKHVIQAAQRWDGERLDTYQDVNGHERTALQMHRWLQRRVLDGELKNPRLTELKKSISDAKVALDQALNAPEEIRLELMRTLDVAVGALVKEVSSDS